MTSRLTLLIFLAISGIISANLTADGSRPSCTFKYPEELATHSDSSPDTTGYGTSTDFDWTAHEDEDGVVRDYVALTANQNLPQACGSCWAIAAAASLSSRFNIGLSRTAPEVNISAQNLLSCDTITGNKGCDGGNPGLAFQFIKQYGITDDTCAPYQAKGWTNDLKCPQTSVCATCDETGDCSAPDTFKRYHILNFGAMASRGSIETDLKVFGPMACTMHTNDQLINYQGGVLNITEDAFDDRITVLLVGVGRENGNRYWKLRNFWGDSWGENGYVRIKIGQLGLGHECWWVKPDLENLERVSEIDYSTPSNTSIPLNIDLFSAEVASSSFLTKRPLTLQDVPELDFHSIDDLDLDLDYDENEDGPAYSSPCSTGSHFHRGERVLNKLSVENFTGEFPDEFTWANRNGINYLTSVSNTLSPKYCGSCWAESALGVIQDRLNILTNKAMGTQRLSIQTVLNCQAGGTCEGGNPAGVFYFGQEHGIPNEMCHQYTADDSQSEGCSANDVCTTCLGPSPAAGSSMNDDQCNSIDFPQFYFVKEYASITGGSLGMKLEIMTRGPITCAIDATKKFSRYSKGVFYQYKSFPVVNHEVTVVGWGLDNGIEYWIGRSSWGTAWGEDGYFRIVMDTPFFNLGIESNCSYGVPGFY